jgi:5-formyltetrahydrofolate cyclo-ligase
MEPAERKREIRQAILARRSQLSDAFQKEAAASLVAPLKDLLAQHLASVPRPLHIGVYAAMRRELDLALCWPLLQAWPATLYFPAVSQGKRCRAPSRRTRHRTMFSGPAISVSPSRLKISCWSAGLTSI